MNKQPLRFYVDPMWRRDLQHIPLLYPFWGNVLDPKRVPFQHALFERHNFDTTQYEITEDVGMADMILMPYNHRHVLYHYPELLLQCVAESKKQGKVLLIDGTGDIECPVDIPNTLVLRSGGYYFSRKENEIPMPFYADDLLEAYCNGQLQLRQKAAKASIGFSGWAELTLVQYLRTVVKELPDRVRSIFNSNYAACKKGIFFRIEAIDVLKHSALVDSHIVVRGSYSGHISAADGDQGQLRREFVDNLLESDYGLDVRGDSNASIRLFETLSLGRIPVIIDTERNFPFSDKLDYTAFSLKVDFRDLQRLPEILAKFHASLTTEKFEAMQKNARWVYRNYFRVDALTAHLIEALREKISTA